MPGTYPNYTANTKSLANDLPGRADIMNGQDYNDHDVQILAHQSAIANIISGATPVPLTTIDGGSASS